jgi:hypothetical protein
MPVANMCYKNTANQVVTSAEVHRFNLSSGRQDITRIDLAAFHSTVRYVAY